MVEETHEAIAVRFLDSLAFSLHDDRNGTSHGASELLVQVATRTATELTGVITGKCQCRGCPDGSLRLTRSSESTLAEVLTLRLLLLLLLLPLPLPLPLCTGSSAA